MRVTPREPLASAGHYRYVQLTLQGGIDNSGGKEPRGPWRKTATGTGDDARWQPRSTALFLFATALTSLTGFLFPIHGFTPALGVGIVACVILAFALFALYKERLAGAWRPIYVITAIISLYLNVFVLVAQSFMKVMALNALAPTQSEPPFVIAQAAVLTLFVLIALIALVRFRPAASVQV